MGTDDVYRTVPSVDALFEQLVVPVGAIAKAHADRNPQRIVLTDEMRSVTWLDFERSTNRLARAYADLGVRPGDIVTIALPNSIEYYEAAFAAWKCGATPSAIPPAMPAAEAQEIVDLAKPGLIVGGPPELRGWRRIELGFVPGGHYSDEADDWPLPKYWKATTSGGSTGRPKIIVSHQPPLFDPQRPIWGQPVGGTIVNVGPLYHNAPFMSSMLALYSGNHIVIARRFDPVETLELLSRYSAQYIFLVPTMMSRIWHLGEEVRSRYDLSALQTVHHSASSCPQWLKEAWINWLGPDVILEGYGGTEQQGGTFITGREWLDHRGSVGRATPGSRLLVLEENGSEVGVGQVGEVYFAPADPSRTTYHYIGAEASQRDGAESVGDLGYVDAEGYLWLVDRRVDLIVSGGANVYPAEVESALDEHPKVLSSIAIGLPDDDLGARVHAIVQLRPDAGETADSIKAFLSGRIAPYKIPRTFEFVTESLRDDAGKARRSRLREERVASASDQVAEA